MQFEIPTTQQQMYETLNEIFYYYRIRREGWEGIELLPLTLERVRWSPLTETGIKNRVNNAITPEISLANWKETQNVDNQISSLQEKKINLALALEEQKNLITEQYSNKAKLITQDALSRGTANSTIVTNALANLETEKSKLIEEATENYTLRVADIDAMITALESKKNDIIIFYRMYKDDLYNAKFQLEVDVQNKAKEDALKYNNGIEEKEVKHANSVATRSADLEMKIRELNQSFFSKDQLIEMGYYEDVINCVCGYYDTLDPMTAYQQFNTDKKVTIYLEDYYANILYYYRSRAGQ